MPMSTTTVADPGGSDPSTRRVGRLGAWPLTTTNPDATPRWVSGMPASAGAAIAERDAGHDLERHAGSRQRRRFFAAAAEHERIAGLEPHDALAAPRGVDDELVDTAVLRERLPAGALAPPTRASRRRRKLARLLRDQAVVRARGRPPAAAESRARSAAPDRRDRRRRATTKPATDRRDSWHCTRGSHVRRRDSRASRTARRTGCTSASISCGRRSAIGTPVDRHSRFSSSARAEPLVEVLAAASRRALRAAGRPAPARGRWSKSRPSTPSRRSTPPR